MMIYESKLKISAFDLSIISDYFIYYYFAENQECGRYELLPLFFYERKQIFWQAVFMEWPL